MRPDRFVDTYVTVQDVRREDLCLQKEEVVDAMFVTFEEVCQLWAQGKCFPGSGFPVSGCAFAEGARGFKRAKEMTGRNDLFGCRVY